MLVGLVENVFDDIMHLMSGGNSVEMVYIDFAKAFEHGVLLHKIKTLCITGRLGVPFYKMTRILYMIGLLVIICLLMPKNSNIYVLVPILH